MSSLFRHFPDPQTLLLYEILSWTNFQKFTTYSKSMEITNKYVMQIFLTSLNLKAFKYTLKGKKGSSFKSNKFSH